MYRQSAATTCSHEAHAVADAEIVFQLPLYCLVMILWQFLDVNLPSLKSIRLNFPTICLVYFKM